MRGPVPGTLPAVLRILPGLCPALVFLTTLWPLCEEPGPSSIPARPTAKGPVAETPAAKPAPPAPAKGETAAGETAAGKTGGGNIGAWKPIFRGVEHATAEAKAPRPLRLHAVRVDLTDPDIDFLVTPPNRRRAGQTDGLKTSTFLTKHSCQVAVNASPFRPVGAVEGEPRDILGLSISRGERYSKEEEGRGVLLIDKDRKARVSRPPVDMSKAYNAMGGFGLLLEDGRNVGEDDALHPRTAVGISKDGRYLIILVIDGRQPGWSDGATTAETAEWLRSFGAEQGLNLDGGGSTTLVVSDGKGGAKVMNRPIHAGIPGTERVNGNHLGVFAKPLK